MPLSLRRLLQTFTLVNIAYTPVAYQGNHPEIAPFNARDYWGRREQGIATIRYTQRLWNWKSQPFVCHGIFVDPLKVVCPCSCLAFPGGGDAIASTPWFHQTDDGYPLVKVEARYFSVGVLTDEFLVYSGKVEVNKVGVSKVQLAQHCSPNYRSNMGILTLRASPTGIKLAWLYSADWLIMKWALEKAIIGAATGGGRCEVMRWANHGKPLKEGSRREVARARFHERPIRYDVDGNMRVLQAQAVNILPWHECLEQVCPQYTIPPYDKIGVRWDPLECNNDYNVTRYCVSWQQMDSLCLLPEGTPVFCDVGEIHGAFGLLVNHTIWCDAAFNFRNVMVGIDTIMNALYKVARVRNGPGYDSFAWPDYLDEQKTPDDYSLQK